MKRRLLSIAASLVFGLAATHSGFAMSELVSLTIEPQWPTTTNPGNVILYKITTVGREGQGLLEVRLSCGGLPAGMNVSFAPDVLRFTGRAVTNQTSIMTVTCPSVMPTDIYPFTLTGAAQRETLTATNELRALPAMPSEPPKLDLDLLDGTTVWIRGMGAGGQTYRIETTTDLANPDWVEAGQTTADGNGRFSYFFSAPVKTEPKRFYRAVWTPPAEAAAK